MPWTAVIAREQISTQQHLCSPPQQPWAVDLHAFIFMVAAPLTTSLSCIAQCSPAQEESTFPHVGQGATAQLDMFVSPPLWCELSEPFVQNSRQKGRPSTRQMRVTPDHRWWGDALILLDAAVHFQGEDLQQREQAALQAFYRCLQQDQEQA